jgi:hypothetical protein
MNLTFNHDVAPHLRRGLQFRAKRIARSEANERKQRAVAWRATVVIGLSFWAVMALGAYLIVH